MFTTLICMQLFYIFKEAGWLSERTVDFKSKYLDSNPNYANSCSSRVNSITLCI